MINSQNLINKICSRISCGGMSDLQTCQTTGALNLLNSPVVSVSTFANLPNATEYAGRLIYVENEKRYYHAVDGYWLNRLNSEVFNYVNSIWAVGSNGEGRLGDNTTVNKSSPVSVVGDFTDWCQVSAGGRHSIGLRTNGTLWAWGYNLRGQLGDNSNISRSSPVPVVGGFTDWIFADAGCEHNLGIRANGTLWAWGRASLGQLGDNNNISRSSPVSVVGGFTDWCQVSAGGTHSLAVRTNGTLWAWGFNGFGQLGDTTTVLRSSPQQVFGSNTDWISASAGYNSSFGIKANGTLFAWGRNNYGQLGTGAVVNQSAPQAVVGGFTDWISVSGGREHSLGVRANGTLWAWGRNIWGQLGDSTTTNKNSPVSVVGGFTNWCQISAYQHSLGIQTNGTLWAWGCNAQGQLGDNTIVSKSSPVSVVGGFTNWCQVSAGSCHNIAIHQVCKGF